MEIIQQDKTLESILQLWFPTDGYQSFWFDKSVDNYIKKFYLQLLEKEEAGSFEDQTDSKQLLSRIILLDQFTRNIYRGSPEAYKNDSKALKLSLSIINNNRLQEFPFNHQVFILMPLRHTKQHKYLDQVRSYIELYSPKTPQDALLHNKFKHATLAAYSDLEEDIRVHQYDIPLTESDSVELERSDAYLTDSCGYHSVLDYDCVNWVQFAIGLRKDVVKNKLYKTMEKYFKNCGFSNIAVSLSGGVDSMVILDICRHLLANNQIKAVWAIHMEYANREEDGPKETKFLKEYCQTLKIPIVVRKIHYMRRDQVDREFYEEETRKARFTTYRYMMREFGVDTFCLGHHSGDLAENVLMNIFKGRDILDLFVMNETEEQFGVTLSRPLLPHPKLDIFEYAEENHIPYFKDTTPDWSCRGVLRRKILPKLEHQWGNGIYNTLAAVGKNSSEWGAVIENAVIQPFLKSVERSDDGFNFKVTNDLLNYPRVFWHKVLMDLFHSYGCKMISNKNFDSILEMLKKRYDSTDPLKLAFSNGCLGEFKKNILTINLTTRM